MTKPRLIDLYCSAGGCTKGYQRAGFHVIGVDIEPQPRYCGDEFIQMNALEFLERYLNGEYPEADAFGASPPCQRYTELAKIWRAQGPEYDKKHLDLIPQTRKLLQATGKPYVIENVPGAPLECPIELCGNMFGLRVYRHRLFESNVFMLMPPHVAHKDNTPRAGYGVSSKGYISVAGHMGNIDYVKQAMGIDWMIGDELSQAIPPAYTQWIGERLLETMAVTI
jgi:DNA (cytosine-5)-methyltransferase 1